MNIVVLVKQVPDSGLERQLTDELTVDRDGANNVIGELDEHAIEAALQLQADHGGEVTILTVGPDSATETIRKSLAMGADKAVHVEDEDIEGSCALGTSKVLAGALKKLEWDLVISGAESTDSGMGVMPYLLSAHTGAAAATGARKIEFADGTFTIEHQTDNGYQVIQTASPAIVSVWDTINTPRYPSLKGIMAAKRKPLESWDLEDIDVESSEVGKDAATTVVVSATKRPPRESGEVVTDEGEGGNSLAEFLAKEKFI